MRIYKGDEVSEIPAWYSYNLTKLKPGEPVLGKYFDGVPALVKQEISPPKHKMKVSKDVMVPMRDGVKLSVDLYLPDAEGRFPALVSWGMWGKDNQEIVLWIRDYAQPYTSPFWCGNLETGDMEYFVSRGYAYVVPDPRGVGKSGGGPVRSFADFHNPNDIYDLVEWVAAQPWCNGKVGMVGLSSFANAQIMAAIASPPHLVAVFPICPFYPQGDPFTGMVDLTIYAASHGRLFAAYPIPVTQWGPPLAYDKLSNEEVEKVINELLEHPDIKYNAYIRTELLYTRFPPLIDQLIQWFYPEPVQDNFDKIKIPIYIGNPGASSDPRLHASGYEAYNKVASKLKKLIFCSHGELDRPFVHLHEEICRWYDYFLKEIDTGIMDEPPVKLFLGGINKWKFEEDWPPRDMVWKKLYPAPGERLVELSPSTTRPDILHQPCPLKDPTVYCLIYRTPPFEQDVELIGPSAFYLEASIDQDDVNWIIDVHDVYPDGSKYVMTRGFLRASFRALDEEKSKPWAPYHKRQRPAPVPKGEKVTYAIYVMPFTWVMQKDHRLEVVIRTQDDLTSKLGLVGLYFLPRMVDVTVNVWFGENCYLLIPTKGEWHLKE